MKDKIKILFIPSTISGGVYYYRVYTPMKALSDMFPDKYEITINNTLHFTDEEIDFIGKNYDIVVFHNCLYLADAQERIWKAIVYCKKEYGTKFVLDIDDYWDYGKLHPYNNICQYNAFPQKMMMNFKLFDYVSTTTEFFADKIRQYNSNVVVFENAISLNDAQFSMKKSYSDRIRIGMTGGSSHTEDIKCLMGFWKHLSSRTLDKIEIVLCGYDIKNNKRVTIDDNGKKIDEVDLGEKNNWWVNTEKEIITGVGNDHYNRIESKSIMEGKFGPVYEDIDILLAPLKNTEFNNCKSELKFIEAGFTGTAIISSKVVPYSNFGIDQSDCLLVKDNTPEGWARKITKLVNDNELRNRLASNLSLRVKTIRSLEKITEKRNFFFDSLV